jgi:uncharacterized protein
MRVPTPFVAEWALTATAVGVVAMHVIDDNFLQPQPGTSAADHLVSGLVPLALLTWVAVGSRRLRPGARAAWALLAAFFGVLTGTEAAYYTLHGGPSGDDITGMAATLAGVALLGVGVVTLWHSRRTDDGLWRRYLRRLAIVTGAMLVAGFALFPISIAYVVTHTARAEVPAPILGAPHEEVMFTTSDGLRLRGWFVPSRNGATVIVVPGRSAPQQQARMLVLHGYGVLLFDRRGEGASEGDPNVFGWGGDRDLDAAVAYLQSRSAVNSARIGAIGLSVGGEMLLHAAAHSDAFRAVVCEGASGESLRDQLANPGLSDRLSELPTQLFLTASLAVFGNELPPRSLISEVPGIAAPVYFIYGEDGQGGTEVGPNRAFYAAANEQSQIWEVSDGQHIAGITTQPGEYERRVVGFFDHALLDRR